MKSEPHVLSIDQMEKLGTTPWDGVRNYQARNNMKNMSVGDLAFFYHSSVKPPGIVGIVKISKTAYPDHTARDPKSPYYDPKSTEGKPIWEMVNVDFVLKFDRPLTLDEIKQEGPLSDMTLLARGRLSVQPVTPEQFHHILKLRIST